MGLITDNPIGSNFELIGRRLNLTREAPGIDPNNIGIGGQDFTNAIQGLPGLSEQLGTRGPSQFRGDQQALIDLLQQQAMGQGPGQQLAKLRADEQARRGLSNQLSMAASAAPGNQGLAARQAAQNAAGITQNAAQTAVQGGLAAQLGATGQLGGVIQGARGQDQGLMQINDAARFNALQQAINANLGLEQEIGKRFAATANQPTASRSFLSLLGGGAQALAGGGLGG